MAASKNTLTDGETRVGWYFDGREETPNTVVALERSRGRAQLTVPLLEHPDLPYNPLFEYFARDIWDKDTNTPRRPPDDLLFEDTRGRVALVGCEAIAGVLGLGTGARSTGRIRARYAVLGAEHAGFSTVNGMRLLSPAISQWLSLSATEVEHTRGEEARPKSVAIRYEAAEPVRAARILNLSFVPSWITSVDPATGDATGRAYTLVETRLKRPREWRAHVDVHRAISDLVNVAGWSDFPGEWLHVLRDDSPMRVLSGDRVGDQWLDTVQAELLIAKRDPERFSFLFEYANLKPGAIRTWLQIRTKYVRAMQPFVALPKMTDTYIENQLLQSSISLDALGHYLDTERAASRKVGKKRQLSYNDALRNVLDDSPWHAVDDTKAWIQRSNAAYMAAKHVDRPEADASSMLQAHRENVMVLRAWLAQRLGVTEERFFRNAFSDPVGRFVRDA